MIVSGSLVAYNPDDPAQAALLAGIAQGETGGSSYAATEGTGASNLAGSTTDQYGFPQWSGVGNSHAAGIYQFQPATWDSIASQYNLNFQNPSDQNAAAWYNAQQTYSAQTGGQSLESALTTDESTGNFSTIQSALAGQWPSVNGNGSLPGGLNSYLSNDVSENGGTFGTAPANAANVAAGSSTGTASSGTSSSSSNQNGWVANIETWLQQFGLVIGGGVIAAIALGFIIWKSGPTNTIKKLKAVVA